MTLKTSEEYHIDVAKNAWAATSCTLNAHMARPLRRAFPAGCLSSVDRSSFLEPWGWCEHDDNRPQLVIPHDENEEEEIHMEQYKLAEKPQYAHMIIVDAEKLFGLSDLKAQIMQFLYKRSQ